MKKTLKVWALVGPRDGKKGETIRALGAKRSDCLSPFYISIYAEDHWFDHFRKDLRPQGFRFVSGTVILGEAAINGAQDVALRDENERFSKSKAELLRALALAKDGLTWAEHHLQKAGIKSVSASAALSVVTEVLDLHRAQAGSK